MSGPTTVDSPATPMFSTPPTSPMVHPETIQPSLSRRNSTRPSNLSIHHATQSWNPDIVLDDQDSPSPAHMNINGNGAGHQQTARSTTPKAIYQSLKPGATSAASSSSLLNGNRSAPPTVVSMNSHSQSPIPIPQNSQPSDSDSSRTQQLRTPHVDSAVIHSPCFVHSHLDKGASFSDWLKQGNGASPPDVGVAPALQSQSSSGASSSGSSGGQQQPNRHRRYRKLDNGQIIPLPYNEQPMSDYALDNDFDFDEEYEEDSGSLTKQLAETAVGVREMSKQLGMFIFTNFRSDYLFTPTLFP